MRNIARKTAMILGVCGLAIALGAGSCGDGNPSDDPSKGFDKCLNHANC